jgi:hypothetical protein
MEKPATRLSGTTSPPREDKSFLAQIPFSGNFPPPYLCAGMPSGFPPNLPAGLDFGHGLARHSATILVEHDPFRKTGIHFSGIMLENIHPMTMVRLRLRGTGLGRGKNHGF